MISVAGYTRSPRSSRQSTSTTDTPSNQPPSIDNGLFDSGIKQLSQSNNGASSTSITEPNLLDTEANINNSNQTTTALSASEINIQHDSKEVLTNTVYDLANLKNELNSCFNNNISCITIFQIIIEQKLNGNSPDEVVEQLNNITASKISQILEKIICNLNYYTSRDIVIAKEVYDPIIDILISIVKNFNINPHNQIQQQIKDIRVSLDSYKENKNIPDYNNIIYNDDTTMNLNIKRIILIMQTAKHGYIDISKISRIIQGIMIEAKADNELKYSLANFVMLLLEDKLIISKNSKETPMYKLLLIVYALIGGKTNGITREKSPTISEMLNTIFHTLAHRNPNTNLTLSNLEPPFIYSILSDYKNAYFDLTTSLSTTATTLCDDIESICTQYSSDDNLDWLFDDKLTPIHNWLIHNYTRTIALTPEQKASLTDLSKMIRLKSPKFIAADLTSNKTALMLDLIYLIDNHLYLHYLDESLLKFQGNADYIYMEHVININYIMDQLKFLAITEESKYFSKGDVQSPVANKLEQILDIVITNYLSSNADTNTDLKIILSKTKNETVDFNPLSMDNDDNEQSHSNGDYKFYFSDLILLRLNQAEQKDITMELIFGSIIYSLLAFYTSRNQIISNLNTLNEAVLNPNMENLRNSSKNIFTILNKVNLNKNLTNRIINVIILNLKDIFFNVCTQYVENKLDPKPYTSLTIIVNHIQDVLADMIIKFDNHSIAAEIIKDIMTMEQYCLELYSPPVHNFQCADYSLHEMDSKKFEQLINIIIASIVLRFKNISQLNTGDLTNQDVKIIQTIQDIISQLNNIFSYKLLTIATLNQSIINQVGFIQQNTINVIQRLVTNNAKCAEEASINELISEIEELRNTMFKFRIYFPEPINDENIYKIEHSLTANYNNYPLYIKARLSSLITASNKAAFSRILLNELFNTALDEEIHKTKLYTTFNFFIPFHKFLSNLSTYYRYLYKPRSLYLAMIANLLDCFGTTITKDIDNNVYKALQDSNVIWLRNIITITTNQEDGKICIQIPKTGGISFIELDMPEIHENQ